jgi:hypothetical protein
MGILMSRVETMLDKKEMIDFLNFQIEYLEGYDEEQSIYKCLKYDVEVGKFDVKKTKKEPKDA